MIVIHELTSHELDIARLLAENMTLNEVAVELGISHSAVKHATERIRWKLELKRTREIPGVLKKLGVID